jgi:hypothetical protein
MWWTGHVENLRAKRNACQLFVGQSEANRPVGNVHTDSRQWMYVICIFQWTIYTEFFSGSHLYQCGMTAQCFRGSFPIIRNVVITHTLHKQGCFPSQCIGQSLTGSSGFSKSGVAIPLSVFRWPDGSFVMVQWIFRNEGGNMWTGFIWHRIGIIGCLLWTW